LWWRGARNQGELEVVLLKNFVNIFFVSELRKKLLFTLGIFAIYRLGIHIPVIGIDINALHQLMSQPSGLGGLFSFLDLFSGGALRQCTIFALGISPYITSSIMMQMLSMTVPSLEQLMKEGEYGRKIINQYTRYLTFAVSIVQSLGYAMLAEKYQIVIQPGWGFRLMFILTLTVGSMITMWLGEQISLFGIGNGSSMIIFSGIVARFPDDFIKTFGSVQAGYLSWEGAVLICLIFVGIAACIVFLEKGERKIPVQYTRRVVGQRVYGGQSSYIPFKINTAGVMPVIFSNALLNIPLFLSTMLAARFTIFSVITEHFHQGSILYMVLDFFLIIFFSYFYTALVFNPEELAENIKKGGGFIPGIRPGKKTAEFFNYILTRIGLIGAIYLGLLAICPSLLNMVLRIPFYLSGTALLIVVGVALDTAAQIESYLIEHRYEGFLSSGRLKARGAVR
jgi:preprotein translocase subunit SecY